ncbi:MAG: SLBB domain-containing protein [Bacteroidetes bacterium]|nr:SLBB domain-containing protein [Bacteroidota bacterium]
MKPGNFSFLACGMLLVGGSLVCHAQSLKERLGEAGVEDKEKLSTSVMQAGGSAMESPVDPRSYVVGPSDRIAVNIWTSPPVSLLLTVTPEGTLIIPLVGELQVSGLTLHEAKGNTIAAVKRRYLRSDVSVTLVQPRPIVVNVVGAVINPGTYTLTAADRAGRAIALANEMSPEQVGVVIPLLPEEISTRNVLIRHRDGTTDRADFPLYLGTKEERYNPSLREGDVVVVPRREPQRHVFGIYGELNLPGRYEIVEGDSVLDALHIAQGFTPLARRDSVIFSRLDREGGVKYDRVINLGAIQSGQEPNFALEPGDRIIVPAMVDLRQDYRIVISGQVKNPGTYPITRNMTRLSEAIRMAGGFTEFASLESAELIRRSISRADVELETLESSRGGIASEDSSYYQLESQLRIRKEIVAVNFHQLFEHNDTTQDVTLKGDDYIIVPSVKQTVYVFGQVVTNGHIPYVQGAPVEHYLQKAGGMTELARKGDLKIVKAKSKQWLSPDETEIEPGDYVWVPREIERSFGYTMGIIGQTASILSVAVSIVLLVIQINK